MNSALKVNILTLKKTSRNDIENNKLTKINKTQNEKIYTDK